MHKKYIQAKQNGAVVIEINPEHSNYTQQISDIYLRGKAGEIKEQGYRFDTGPSLLTMPQVIKDLFALILFLIVFVLPLQQMLAKKINKVIWLCLICQLVCQ